MELGGADDLRRDRTGERRLLVRVLGRVVAGAETFAADDRDDDDPVHTGPSPGRLQVRRHRREEALRRLLVRRRSVRSVDHAAGSCERLCKAVPGDEIDAVRARDPDHVTAARLEALDEVPAEASRCAGDRDRPRAHRDVFHLVLLLVAGAMPLAKASAPLG